MKKFISILSLVLTVSSCASDVPSSEDPKIIYISGKANFTVENLDTGESSNNNELSGGLLRVPQDGARLKLTYVPPSEYKDRAFKVTFRAFDKEYIQTEMEDNAYRQTIRVEKQESRDYIISCEATCQAWSEPSLDYGYVPVIIVTRYDSPAADFTVVKLYTGESLTNNRAGASGRLTVQNGDSLELVYNAPKEYKDKPFSVKFNVLGEEFISSVQENGCYRQAVLVSGKRNGDYDITCTAVCSDWSLDSRDYGSVPVTVEGVNEYIGEFSNGADFAVVNLSTGDTLKNKGIVIIIGGEEKKFVVKNGDRLKLIYTPPEKYGSYIFRVTFEAFGKQHLLSRRPYERIITVEGQQTGQYILSCEAYCFQWRVEGSKHTGSVVVSIE